MRSPGGPSSARSATRRLTWSATTSSPISRPNSTSPTVGATVGTINGTLSGLTSGLVNTLDSLTVANARSEWIRSACRSTPRNSPAGAGRPVKLALSNPAVVTVDLGALLGGAYEGTTASPLAQQPRAEHSTLHRRSSAHRCACARGRNPRRRRPRCDPSRHPGRGLLGLIPVTITGSLADLVSGNATVPAVAPGARPLRSCRSSERPSATQSFGRSAHAPHRGAQPPSAGGSLPF